jgi:hypothetical protein
LAHSVEGSIHVLPVQPVSNVPYEFMPHRIGNEPTPTLRVVGCPGERVNVAFYLADGKPAKQLLVKSNRPDLCDLRWIKWWWQAGRTNFEADRTVYVPELLLHDGSMVQADPRHPDTRNIYPQVPKDAKTLQPLDCDDHSRLPGFEQGVMLTVRIPHEKSGYFSLLITADGQQDKVVPVELRVLPFELPKPRVDHSMYYRAQLNHGEPGVDPEQRTIPQMTADLRSMVEHGIVNPCSATGIEHLDDVLKMRQEVGCDTDRYFTGAVVGPAVLAADFDRSTFPQLKSDTIRYAESVLKECSGYGVKQVYAYCKDEAQAEGIRKQAPLWKAARQGGLKIYGFVGALSEDAMLENLDDLQDVVIRAGTLPSKHLGETLRQSGRKLYIAGHPGGGNEDPVGNRRAQGLMLFNRPWIDGTMEYAWMHVWTGAEHPWDDFGTLKTDHYRSHMYAYPTIDGVVDTLQLEGYAAGVNDYRYLQLLQATSKREAVLEFFERIQREEALIDLDAMRGECIRLLSPPH